MQPLSNYSGQSSWLVWFLKGVLLLGGIVMLGRMFELQIIKGNYFRALADDNRIRKVIIEAPRGEILARGGEVLVGNKEIKKQIVFGGGGEIQKKDIEKDTPNDELITLWDRTYNLGAMFGHVTGYLGEVSEEEANKVDPECTEKGSKRVGTLVGRGGLEEEYKCELRGIDGEQLVEVDTFGKRIRTLGTKEAIKGEDIKTHIDFGLQKKVAQIFENMEGLPTDVVKVLQSQGKKGAAIVTDGKGQILAFYSSPSFDPNVFLQNDEKDSKEVGELLIDKDLPLFNRVTGGAYHPGSVFKIVTSIAALEEKKIDDNFTYDDPGVITINEFKFASWNFTQHGKKEGVINLERALARSTDTFFYKLGELLGPDALALWAEKFGYGELTGIDLPGEVSGIIPTPQWKEKVKGERWFLGNTYHMSIGQGDVTATPLEVNKMTSIIASNGIMCTPSLAREPHCTKLNIDQKYIDKVKKGMTEACSEGGTAFPFFNFEPKIACKTGTAETEEINKTHAWFTSFAPVENPEIVVTVLVEKGGEGSYVASPIAKEILNYWFHGRN